MIKPIDPVTLDVVTYTANAICEAKGYSLTFKQADVEIILQAVRLVKTIHGYQMPKLGDIDHQKGVKLINRGS